MTREQLARLRAAIMAAAPPPIPIPGYGQWVQGRNSQLPDNSIPRWRDSHHKQQAPYKPGQDRRTQEYKRRHGSTRPTPGSVEGRRRPQWN